MEQLNILEKGPLFSVLMANHNREKFITEAIISVLNQTYIHFELLIWDDNSTDQSWEIMERFAKQDIRIKIFKNTTNKGAGFTKNELAKHAQGWVSAFFDSDDTLRIDALERMMQLHVHQPNTVLIYSNHTICDENLIPLRSGSSRKIPKRENHLTFFGISHFCSYKTFYYHQTEGININLHRAVDQDLYYKLEETGAIYFLDDELYFYRHNTESISLNSNKSSANFIKLEVMKHAIQRRKKSKKMRYPSFFLLKIWEWQNSKENSWSDFFLKNPLQNSIALLNYFFYLIKIKLLQKNYFFLL